MAANSDTKLGDLAVGDARLHYWETYLAWYDRWLRDNAHAIDSLPHVQYYVIGRNEWRTSDTWPVRNMRATPYYLRSEGKANTSSGNGRLTTEKPGASDRSDTFTYDPADPVPSRGGSICCTGIEGREKVGTVPVSSAVTTAAADGNLAAGSFSISIMITRARSCGTSARRCSTGVGRSEMCLTRIAGVLFAVNGGSPVSI